MSSEATKRWLEVFDAAMMISDNEWKSSIAVADAAEGTMRPSSVPLPQWGLTLVLDGKKFDLRFHENQDPAQLVRILDKLF